MKKYVAPLYDDDVCAHPKLGNFRHVACFSRIIGFQLDPLSCSFMCASASAAPAYGVCIIYNLQAARILIESACSGRVNFFFKIAKGWFSKRFYMRGLLEDHNL